MSNVGLLNALLIVFIVLCCAGLIVYTVFFSIHKIYFHKEINLIKKYNELVNGLSSINIYKIQVLAKNDIGNKLDLTKYINIHQKLKANTIDLKINIDAAEVQINAFNLKVASKYINSIDKDLNKALKDLAILKKAYDRYTQYGDAIEYTFQNYLEIFESLINFYFDKFNHISGFTRVNNLIETIRKTFFSLPKLSIKFDYKKTIDTTVDLGKKIKTLSDIIILIYRFQIVDVYLTTTKEYNEKMIGKYRSEIARGDLQTLQNLLTVFNHAYRHFNKHYQSLQLGEAKAFAIQALHALGQINQFTYVHVKTPALISLGVNEIKEQTDRIIVSKQEILDGMNDLKQYFVLEPKVIDNFNTIEKNIHAIDALNRKATTINYKTHTEKIRAIDDLDKIGSQIVTCKTEIIQSIDLINDVLSKIIKTVTDLNDLYVYFCQLLVMVKQYVPSGVENTNLQKLIKTNLNQIESYSKQIVTDENPDFDEIAYQISSIIEQSQQIYKQMTSTIVLKAYATKLFAYANRYKKYPTYKEQFAEANKAFKAKKYAETIDILLALVKAAKRYKN